MKKFFLEFKEFALKGNIIDMAIGVIVGGAFGKIVSSLVADIISPLIGLLTGGTDLNHLSVLLRPEETDAAGEVVKAALTLNYGTFIQTIIDFIIIALCLFLVLKGIMAAKNKMEALKKAEEEAPAEEAPADTELSVLLEIKELLEKK